MHPSQLNLRQEDLIVAEYEDKFARLQYLCQLVEDEGHDLISFFKGLRPNVLEKLNECKTIAEAFKEETCIEYICLNCLTCGSPSRQKESLRQ